MKKFRNKDNDVTNGYKEDCDYEHKRSIFDELEEEERIRDEEIEDEEDDDERRNQKEIK